MNTKEKVYLTTLIASILEDQKQLIHLIHLSLVGGTLAINPQRLNTHKVEIG
jgi:hypothetical protein